ncbi:hypothetical protein ERTO105960_09360 [Erysipelothrix tonsillarum]
MGYKITSEIEKLCDADGATSDRHGLKLISVHFINNFYRNYTPERNELILKK